MTGADIDAVEAYPLSWPTGQPRAKYRLSSRYKVPFSKARDDLFRELDLWGARSSVLSTNVPVRRDGLPYAGKWREPDDPGAAIYWIGEDGEPMAMAIDAWQTVRDNVRALGLAVACLRGLERTGSKEVQRQAYAGFKQLPDPERFDALSVLGFEELPASEAEVDARFRQLVKVRRHPDQGGDAEEFARLTRAVSECKQMIAEQDEAES